MSLETMFAEVWSPGTRIAAAVSGVLVGVAFVGPLLAAHTYASIYQTASRSALYVSASTMFTGVVFYAGQAVAAYWEGDPSWARILARYVLWVLFAVCLGLGTYVSLRVSEYRKSRAAKSQAKKNVNNGDSAHHSIID